MCSSDLFPSHDKKMANKQIYQLDDIGTYTNIDDADILHISDTSDGNKDKKASILNILKKILGNRTFGGSGNIVTMFYKTFSKTMESVSSNTKSGKVTLWGSAIGRTSLLNRIYTDMRRRTA